MEERSIPQHIGGHQSSIERCMLHADLQKQETSIIDLHLLNRRQRDELRQGNDSLGSTQLRMGCEVYPISAVHPSLCSHPCAGTQYGYGTRRVPCQLSAYPEQFCFTCRSRESVVGKLFLINETPDCIRSVWTRSESAVAISPD